MIIIILRIINIIIKILITVVIIIRRTRKVRHNKIFNTTL